MFEIVWDETDQEKRWKLKALVLSNDEWNRVELMMKLLHVHFFFDLNILHWHPHWHSMLTMPSKHFHMTASHVFSQVFQLLKLYTPHGRTAQIIQNMNCSRIVWKWPWTRWKNITIRQLLLMHIPLWWVHVLFFSFFVIHLILLIVLNPDTKMSHFTKHWTKSLQDKALKSAETIVCFLLLV